MNSQEQNKKVAEQNLKPAYTGKQNRRVNRAAKKRAKKIQQKLSGYLNAFYSICYFDEKKQGVRRGNRSGLLLGLHAA